MSVARHEHVCSNSQSQRVSFLDRYETLPWFQSTSSGHSAPYLRLPSSARTSTTSRARNGAGHVFVAGLPAAERVWQHSRAAGSRAARAGQEGAASHADGGEAVLLPAETMWGQVGRTFSSNASTLASSSKHVQDAIIGGMRLEMGGWWSARLFSTHPALAHFLRPRVPGLRRACLRRWSPPWEVTAARLPRCSSGRQCTAGERL